MYQKAFNKLDAGGDEVNLLQNLKGIYEGSRSHHHHRRDNDFNEPEHRIDPRSSSSSGAGKRVGSPEYVIVPTGEAVKQAVRSGVTLGGASQFPRPMGGPLANAPISAPVPQFSVSPPPMNDSFPRQMMSNPTFGAPNAHLAPQTYSFPPAANHSLGQYTMPSGVYGVPRDLTASQGHIITAYTGIPMVTAPTYSPLAGLRPSNLSETQPKRDRSEDNARSGSSGEPEIVNTGHSKRDKKKEKKKKTCGCC